MSDIPTADLIGELAAALSKERDWNAVDHQRLRDELHKIRIDLNAALSHLARLEQRMSKVETEDEDPPW